MSMNDPFFEIASDTMQSVWGRTPRLYQSGVIPHILKMMCNVGFSEPILMVQSTGTGKSSVPQTLSTVDGGVTIIIQNT